MRRENISWRLFLQFHLWFFIIWVKENMSLKKVYMTYILDIYSAVWSWECYWTSLHLVFFIYICVCVCVCVFGCARSESQHVESSVFLVACGIFSCSLGDLVPWPGIEPWLLALGAQSLSHWATREVPAPSFPISKMGIIISTWNMLWGPNNVIHAKHNKVILST